MQQQGNLPQNIAEEHVQVEVIREIVEERPEAEV